MRLHCPTCLESISASESLHCLPCGHVFHTHCVLQWFESKKNCPQCRHPANQKNARKIFLSEVDEDSQESADDLRTNLDNLQLQMRLVKTEHENLKINFQEVDANNVKLKDAIKVADKAKRKAEENIKEYKIEIRYWKDERDRFQGCQEEAEQVKKKLEKFTLMEQVLSGSIGDVNMLLHERGSYDEQSRDLATLVVELKKKLIEAKRKKALSDRQVDEVSRLREEERRRARTLSEQIQEMKKREESIDIDIKIAIEDRSRLQEEVKRLETKVQQQEKTISRLQDNQDGGAGMSIIDWGEPEKENDLLSLTLMASPVSIKSCAIMAGDTNRKPRPAFRNEKRSKLGANLMETMEKRSKIGTNLMEIGNQSSSASGSSQGYDGLGGRSKPDIFPNPLRRPTAYTKKPVVKKNSLLAKREKQKNTIDKFFGNFDSP